MALAQATLQSEIENLVPTDVEADAIQAFVDAWDSYFSGASVSGVTITAGSYSAGLTALQAGLSGWSVSGAAAAKIQTAIAAFWTAISTLGPTMWTLPPPAVVLPTPITPPPGVTGISASLTSVWATLAADSGATLADAAQQMAAVLHPNGGLGAICQVQTIPSPPTIVPTPIL